MRYLKGQPTFVSQMPSSVIDIATPVQTNERRIGIGIAAYNLSGQPQSLGYENVSIQTTSGTPVKLLPYEDLLHRARVRAGWALFFTALAGGVNSYAAHQEGYGQVGGYSYYSPVAGQIAMDRAASQNAALMTTVEQQLEVRLASLDATVLRTTTIDPRSTFGGAVVFDLPKGARLQDLVVTITFAGDVHTIPLDPSATHMQQATASDLQPAPAPLPPLPSPPVAQAAPAAAPASSAPERKCEKPAIYSSTDPSAVHRAGSSC